MAFVEPIDPTDINLALEAGLGERLRWQMDRSEYDARLDAAAYAAAAVLNRPYYEADLTPEERANAEQAYRDAPYSIEQDEGLLSERAARKARGQIGWEGE